MLTGPVEGRRLRDEDQRKRLRNEVELLVGMVLGNTVRTGELEELHELQDVVNAAPLALLTLKGLQRIQR